MRFEISSCRRSVFTSFWLAGLTTSDFKNEIFVYLFFVLLWFYYYYFPTFFKEGADLCFCKEMVRSLFLAGFGVIEERTSPQVWI